MVAGTAIGTPRTERAAAVALSALMALAGAAAPAAFAHERSASFNVAVTVVPRNWNAAVHLAYAPIALLPVAGGAAMLLSTLSMTAAPDETAVHIAIDAGRHCCNASGRRRLLAEGSGKTLDYELCRDPACTREWQNGDSYAPLGESSSIGIWAKVEPRGSGSDEAYSDEVTLSIDE